MDLGPLLPCNSLPMKKSIPVFHRCAVIFEQLAAPFIFFFLELIHILHLDKSPDKSTLIKACEDNLSRPQVFALLHYSGIADAT